MREREKNASTLNSTDIVGKVLDQIWSVRLQEIIPIWCLELENYFAIAILGPHAVWDIPI